MFNQAKASDVTPTIHGELYPAISPLRPELCQTGRVVLVTGGGTGIGKSIARSFVRAAADTVIIIGRRAETLAAAEKELQQEAQKAGTSTKVIARPCDISVVAKTEALWEHLTQNNIILDVIVLNAVKTGEAKPLLELGTQEIWSQLDVNVRVSLDFAEKLAAQPGNSKKVSLLRLLVVVLLLIRDICRFLSMLPQTQSIQWPTRSSLSVQRIRCQK